MEMHLNIFRYQGLEYLRLGAVENAETRSNDLLLASRAAK